MERLKSDVVVSICRKLELTKLVQKMLNLFSCGSNGKCIDSSEIWINRKRVKRVQKQRLEVMVVDR